MPVWRPDTCRCAYEFVGAMTDYDVRRKQKCAIHASMADNDAMKHAHLSVNGMKNRCQASMLPEFIDLGDGKRITSLMIDNQRNRREFGSLPEICFYSVRQTDGVILLDFPHYTQQQKTDFQTRLAADTYVRFIKQQMPGTSNPVIE